MEETRLSNTIAGGTSDIITGDTPHDDQQEIVVRSEGETEKTPSVDSSFSEATDEDRLLDEGLERDSLDDEDEIIILKDIKGE
jgi:hypothetical protein